MIIEIGTDDVCRIYLHYVLSRTARPIMLPRPCLSFTLPSIYDDTKLDCRLYHPLCLRDPSHSETPWSGHAAVVAHPYAPLGGCFDDPIVDLAAGTLLQLGFLVATFNFRSVLPAHMSRIILLTYMFREEQRRRILRGPHLMDVKTRAGGLHIRRWLSSLLCLLSRSFPNRNPTEPPNYALGWLFLRSHDYDSSSTTRYHVGLLHNTLDPYRRS